MPALLELEAAYEKVRKDKSFKAQFNALARDYIGRPTPLYYAQALSKALGGHLKVYLKREDLCHTGAHKVNNTLGQILLAKKWVKSASSLKPVPDSTALPQRPCAHC